MDGIELDLLDSPVSTPASRRSVLIGISVALFVAACGERRQKSAAAPIEPEPDPAFLALSRALTGKQDLDPLTAARLSDAFRRTAPDIHNRFADLARLTKSGPVSLLALDNHHLRAAALAIVAAWYTGSLGKGPRTVTVAYRDALMQRTVADAMYPPTYALGGPGWWTEAPPPVDRQRSHGARSTPAPANDHGPER